MGLVSRSMEVSEKPDHMVTLFYPICRKQFLVIITVSRIFIKSLEICRLGYLM